MQNENKPTPRGGGVTPSLLFVSCHLYIVPAPPQVYTKVEAVSFILKVLHELLKAHSVCRDN